MRIFEVLIIVNLLLILIIHKKGERILGRFLKPLSLALILLHLIFEGGRWSMAPSYLLTGILILKGLAHRFSLRRPRLLKYKGVRITGFVFSYVLVIISGSLSFLLPVFQLPEPEGPYSVGVVEMDLTDRSREEVYTEQEGDFRELHIKVWYPAASSEDPVVYLDKGYRQVLTETLNIPADFLGYLDMVRSHSSERAPWAASDTPFPVLIFSHGFGSVNISNTRQMEHLASNGYVIFSISHPYDASVTAFTDGRTVGFQDNFGQMDPNPEGVEYFKGFMNKENPEDVRSENLLKYSRTAAWAPPTLNVWVQDTIFVRDYLETLNSNMEFFKGKLDLKRTGIFGHSFGGATAAFVCSLDKRFSAGLNYDGLQFDWDGWGFEQPFMMMTAEDHKGMNSFMDSSLTGPLYRINVKNANHLSFSDLSLISPLLGMIKGERISEIVNTYTLSFFDTYVKGHDSVKPEDIPLLAEEGLLQKLN